MEDWAKTLLIPCTLSSLDEGIFFSTYVLLVSYLIISHYLTKHCLLQSQSSMTVNLSQTKYTMTWDPINISSKTHSSILQSFCYELVSGTKLTAHWVGYTTCGSQTLSQMIILKRKKKKRLNICERYWAFHVSCFCKLVRVRNDTKKELYYDNNDQNQLYYFRQEEQN